MYVHMQYLVYVMVSMLCIICVPGGSMNTGRIFVSVLVYSVAALRTEVNPPRRKKERGLE